MITAELTRKIDLLPQESYDKVEIFVEQLIAANSQANKEKAFKIFMDKMTAAEKSVQEEGCYSEEEELADIEANIKALEEIKAMAVSVSENFDYDKELAEAREEKYGRFA